MGLSHRQFTKEFKKRADQQLVDRFRLVVDLLVRIHFARFAAHSSRFRVLFPASGRSCPPARSSSDPCATARDRSDLHSSAPDHKRVASTSLPRCVVPAPHPARPKSTAPGDSITPIRRSTSRNSNPAAIGGDPPPSNRATTEREPTPGKSNLDWIHSVLVKGPFSFPQNCCLETQLCHG